MPLRASGRVAISAQQFCSNETAVNLFVSDGISKTAVWKKQDVLSIGTSQMQERSSFGTRVRMRATGLHLNYHSRTGDIKMRIAQVAPLTEAVPPKLYGGTERVVHWLTEELVALGHDVTLFAS